MVDPTAAERQAAFRKRKREAGLEEVRGIWLPPALHDEIRQIAAKMEKDYERKP